MVDEYLKAKKYGDREYRSAVSKGQYPYLPSLDYILKHEGKLQEERIGLIEIPVNLIVGTLTEGRQNAFSRGFLPLLEPTSEFASKWETLFASQAENGMRDPIKVYEYMRKFYVQEGNKRVSVSKILGYVKIMAEVIRVYPQKTDDLENKLYYEFVDFYKAAPIYEVAFSSEGGYLRLAKHFGLNITHPWSEEEISKLKHAYEFFAEIFAANGGYALNITAGDALLIYLDIYGVEGILDESSAVIKRRLTKLWKEILTSANKDSIDLLEDPGLLKRNGSILKSFKTPSLYTPKNPLKIAFIYEDDPDQNGLSYDHELGRNYINSNFEGLVKAIAFKERDTDEKIREAIDEAEAEKCNMVFTTSPSQMPECLRGAIHYPHIKFLNCSLNLSHNAVRTYAIKMFGAKFLMGILAAAMADNDDIGYLSYVPIYGEIANINAFAIGASMVNPAVKVHLSWAYKKPPEKGGYNINDISGEMKGIKVFSGSELNKSNLYTKEFGIYYLNEDGEKVSLALPVRGWGKYYEMIVKTVLDGSWGDRSIAKSDQALNYWWGIQSGVVDILLSEKLPYPVKKLIGSMKDAMIAGTIHPFEGELHSQDGLVQGADGGRLTSQQIITMDWLNENIVGSIPGFLELSEAGQKIVSVSGVDKESE
ncbi:MAG: BMP family ABC transporter substrate-binding protein [Lachnospiraceae bacterium]|nr:BMP family ABC transporter substrate-binding protein [Lachnospiraceae bacterium]